MCSLRRFVPRFGRAIGPDTSVPCDVKLFRAQGGLFDMTLQRRLAVGFSAIGILFLMMALLTAGQLRQIDGQARSIDHNVHLTNIVSEWTGHTRINLERALMLLRSERMPALMTEQVPRMKTTSERISELQQDIERLGGTELQPLLQEVAQRRRDYLVLRTQLMDSPEGESNPQLLDEKMVPAAQDYLVALQRIENHVKARVEAESADMLDLVQEALYWLTGSALLVLFGSSVIGCSVHRYVWRVLGGDPEDVKRIANAVAHGELQQPVVLRPGDQHSVMVTMKRMRDQLASTVQTVRQGAEAVANASVQIAASTEDLAQRTRDQATALEEAQSALLQLNQQAEDTASGAARVNDMAQRTMNDAEQGCDAARDVAATMRAIRDQSSAIERIVGVIDSIAFQTNMLALNAAVEAARAGDTGRGFAVVASAVRTLAQRSAEASGDIRSLVHQSVGRIEHGDALADQAGSAIAGIVQQVRQVCADMSHIRSMGYAQKEATDGIKNAITAVNVLAQQNSGLVEESSAAAAHLREQAAQLSRAISVFKLDTFGAVSADTAPAPGVMPSSAAESGRLRQRTGPVTVPL